jgi:endonuclease/exonuclease/phosphatase (EEP) superfamily protein YafD
MKFIKYVIVIFHVVIGQFVYADYTRPSDGNVIFEAGQASTPAKNHLRLLVWNIEKAQASTSWLKDFNMLLKNSDVVLLQEAYFIPVFEQAISDNLNFQWTVASSFSMFGVNTGVATLSRWPVARINWFRSPGTEPVLSTHKMALTTLTHLPSGQDLLFMNIHGLNFTSTRAFREQINPLLAALSEHRGPIIFAGDFNTWNSKRLQFLRSALGQIGLTEAQVKNDPRRLILDRVFYRDVKIEQFKVRSDVKTSDHYPLQLLIRAQ